MPVYGPIYRPVYEVGKPFVPGVIRWPEHAEYTVRAGGHELRLFWGDPPPAAVAAIRGAPCEFAAAHLRGVLFLLYRFEGVIASSAVPYTRGHTGRRDFGPGHTSPTRMTPVPGPAAGAGAAEHDDARPQYSLAVYLVDADTGVLRAVRTVGLSPSLAAALEGALREERARPFRSDYAYGREIAGVLARYPSARAMLPWALAHCRCEG